MSNPKVMLSGGSDRVEGDRPPPAECRRTGSIGESTSLRMLPRSAPTISNSSMMATGCRVFTIGNPSGVSSTQAPDVGQESSRRQPGANREEGLEHRHGDHSSRACRAMEGDAQAQKQAG